MTGHQKDPFLSAGGALLEHEFIFENRNRQLSQKYNELIAYSASFMLKQCNYTRKYNKTRVKDLSTTFANWIKGISTIRRIFAYSCE